MIYCFLKSNCLIEKQPLKYFASDFTIFWNDLMISRIFMSSCLVTSSAQPHCSFFSHSCSNFPDFTAVILNFYCSEQLLWRRKLLRVMYNKLWLLRITPHLIQWELQHHLNHYLNFSSAVNIFSSISNIYKPINLCIYC